MHDTPRLEAFLKCPGSNIQGRNHDDKASLVVGLFGGDGCFLRLQSTRSCAINKVALSGKARAEGPVEGSL
jgi:hypothetical protein